jgi:hypothetical protein
LIGLAAGSCRRTQRETESRKEPPMSVVTILVIIVLILLAIYLFRRIA